MTKNLDLGCGSNPKNPFGTLEVYGVDIRDMPEKNIVSADLAVEPIPFDDYFFDSVSAYDFIEHIPRVIYCPQRKFAFVDLMNEIHRVLKFGGLFYSFTPAFPQAAAWQDPTHVNIITESTFPLYFDDKNRWATMYGYNGYFEIVEQKWHGGGVHLETTMRKVAPPPPEEATGAS